MADRTNECMASVGSLGPCSVTWSKYATQTSETIRRRAGGRANKDKAGRKPRRYRRISLPVDDNNCRCRQRRLPMTVASAMTATIIRSRAVFECDSGNDEQSTYGTRKRKRYTEACAYVYVMLSGSADIHMCPRVWSMCSLQSL